MQEEVTGKSVAVIIKGAKISEKVLEKALGKLLEVQRISSRRFTAASRR